MNMHSTKVLPHCSQIYVEQIIGNSFFSTATLLTEAIWTEIRNTLCIPSNLLSHRSKNNLQKISDRFVLYIQTNVVYEFTMHRHNTCILKSTATLLKYECLKKYLTSMFFTATLLTQSIWTELRGVVHISLSYFRMPVTPLTD